MSSGEEELAAWLRREIGYAMAAAREVIAACIKDCARPCDFHPAAAAEWHEMSSGVLDICEGLDRADTWEGVWAVGDSRVTRFIAANDPRSVIARCEADLAILDEHARLPAFPVETLTAWRAAGIPEERIVKASAVASCARCHTPVDDAREDEDQCLSVAYPCRTVRLLGYGYRFRPGYREGSWNP